MTSNGDGGETVHISLGTTANFITSHLLNLQGLAATASSSSSPSSRDSNYDGLPPNRESSLCDPSVTHCISSSSSSSSRLYVPRTLIVDGRDSFGTPWGAVHASSSTNNHSVAVASHDHSTWSGQVSLFDPTISLFGKNNDAITTIDENDPRLPPRQQSKQQQQHDNYTTPKVDPLLKFREAASLVGISSQHSRFRVTSSSAAAASPYSTYNANNEVNFDEEEEEEEEEEELDDYDRERRQRQLNTIQHQNRIQEKEWKSCIESSWEEAFYYRSGGGNDGGGNSSAGNGRDTSSSPFFNTSSVGMVTTGNNDGQYSDSMINDASNDDTLLITNSKKATTSSSLSTTTVVDDNEREIQWHDYWMPPRPRVSDYQVPLPFDTWSSSSSSASSWSTSFNRGYNPTSSGGNGEGGGGGGNGCDGSISNSWREHVLSEKLRRMLEASDIVKGFNLFVDGGIGIPTATAGGVSQLSSNATTLAGGGGGGGFHAGLATSLLEELSEECRSAGRWAIMVDPPAAHHDGTSGDESSGWGSDHPTNRFRQRLNAGLALHGLTTNADAFLPVSIDNAHHALYHDCAGIFGKGTLSSPNRVLFEGSAAISLALEASTLFYRLRRNQQNIPVGGSRFPGAGAGATRRSRIGIQSGYYQGYGGSSNRYEECDNEPYATSPSMTYHEFLACLRPSSDRRRSILELDALLHPISYPTVTGGILGSISGGGMNAGNVLSSSLLTSLTSSGVIGNSNSCGELQRRMMRGTSLELMILEQRGQQYRSSRGRSSTTPTKPGEWLDDVSTKTSEGGGLLSSLSGNATPFGRRSDHRHFALSASLRPSDSDSRTSSGTNAINVGGDCVSSFLRPMMECMGSNYRPEVSSGLVVKDSVVELTELGSYWRSVFSDRRLLQDNSAGSRVSPSERASRTPVLSVLGNSTRSYPRLKSVSTGMIDALQSRCNMGYFSRDVMSGLIPEKDDCGDALEYCRELVDVYEPPMGSGLVSGDDENDTLNAYFDESD